MSLPIPRFKRLSVTIGQSNRRVSSSFNSALGFCARLFRRGLPHSMVIRRAGPDSRSGTPRKGRQKMKKHVLFVLLVLLFVAVSGNALQVDTATSTLKQVIEQQRLVEMPLEGRNAAKLTLLVPGAVYSANGGADQGTTKTFPGAVTISANGARQDMVSYQLDGGNYVDEYTNVNQPFPFPDALQEFSVQTSNYSAEYGQNAGAVVNVITKSGTNNFHGDVF